MINKLIYDLFNYLFYFYLVILIYYLNYLLVLLYKFFSLNLII